MTLENPKEFSRLAIVSLLFASVLAWTPKAWAQAAPVEFAGTSVAGDQLVVDLLFDPGVAPGQTFKVRYLDRHGNLLDAAAAPIPAGGELEVLLEGHFLSVAGRGWQHRLQVVDGLGVEVAAIDLRLGLDCDATGLCEIETLPGLFVDGAVSLSADLAPLFKPGKVVDLPKIVLDDPALTGPAVELAVDLLTQIVDSQTGCACFYAFDVPTLGGMSESVLESTSNGSMEEPMVFIGYFKDQLYADSQRFEAGHTTLTQLDMDFHCYTVASLVQSQATISSGILWSDLTVLEPCSAGCASPVDWQLDDFAYGTRLDPNGHAMASSEYSLTWNLDGAQAFHVSSGFGASGASSAPVSLSGQAQAPAAVLGQTTPSSSVIKANTAAEIGGWSMLDLPSAEISLEGSLSAIGRARCAPPTQVRVSLLRVNGPGKATLAVVLGPDSP